jgi:putative oxidoreductase
MKIVTIVFRVLIGLFLLFASITYFFPMGEQPAPTGDMATVFAGFMATKYLMPLAKVVELLAGLSYVSGKFMKLFNLVLLPVSLNILLLNIFPSQEALPIAAVLFLGNLFFIYKDWDSYKEIVKP